MSVVRLVLQDKKTDRRRPIASAIRLARHLSVSVVRLVLQDKLSDRRRPIASAIRLARRLLLPVVLLVPNTSKR